MGIQSLSRIMRLRFRLQLRIAVNVRNLCAKRVQCSSWNIFTRTAIASRVFATENVPVGTLSHSVVRSHIESVSGRLFRLEHFPESGLGDLDSEESGLGRPDHLEIQDHEGQAVMRFVDLVDILPLSIASDRFAFESRCCSNSLSHPLTFMVPLFQSAAGAIQTLESDSHHSNEAYSKPIWLTEPAWMKSAKPIARMGEPGLRPPLRHR